MSKKEKTEISTREKKTKRLKTHHARPNILSIIPVNVDCFRLEEVEPADNILDEVSQTSDKIREHMLAICFGKKGKENEVTLYQHREHVSMLMMHMKKMNRLDKHQWKKSRDAVNEQKQRVDAKHLLYQNLLYEATHLQKEVTKCLEFRSKDEEIELVSIEEFYRDAPEHISKPEITKFDQHELTLARLFWESEQRKEFAQKLKEAEIAMQEYIQIRKKLEENLSSVLPILKSIIDAAEPMQTKMGMPFRIRPLKQKIAKYLPKSLYVLYVQISAYCEHHGGKRIQISVEGNVSDAKALQTKTVDLSDDSGESDREESSEMNTHRRAASQKKTESCKDILMKHPMTVQLTIDRESKLTLEFCYLVHLNIVTVRVLALTPEPMSTDSVGDLLQLDSFLNCLFPGDCGKNSPNLACIHQLKTKYGYDDPPFKNETTGWPYDWAQKIAGLQFMAPLPEKDWLLKSSYKEIPASVDKTIHAMCSRLESRYQLYQQINSIEQRINVPPTFSSLYPLNISSQLKKWSPVSWKRALSYPNIQELQDLGILNEDMLLYKAEIQRGSALLTVLIAIPPNYPEKTPIFLLQLSWKGSHTTVSSFALRELEEEVNVHFVENLPQEFKTNLLVCQVYHLVVCFDVFLETESSGDSFEGPSEFMREKVVVRYTRGCGRSRPYKCVSSQGIFTYR